LATTLDSRERWLKSTTAENVESIRFETYGHGEPGRMEACYRTEDKSVIEKYIENCSNLNIKRIPLLPNLFAFGGGNDTVTFIFSNGETKDIKFLQGNYIKGLSAYDVNYSSVYELNSLCDQYWKFLISDDDITVYSDLEETKPVGTLEDADDIRFVKLDTVEYSDEAVSGISFTRVVSIGAHKLLITSDTEFYMITYDVGRLAERGIVHCELIDGETFSDLMD
jgi:hypothetical protein